jgi:dolichol-phosphate mannosyltransferase
MAREMLGQLIQFAIVGGLGTLTNLCIFFAFVDVGGGDPLLGACIAFAVAVTQNYVLNEIWTFRRIEAPGLSRGRYGKFVLFSTLALGVNLAVLQLLISHFQFSLLVIPQAVGILAATALNFVASRLVTFR